MLYNYMNIIVDVFFLFSRRNYFVASETSPPAVQSGHDKTNDIS